MEEAPGGNAEPQEDVQGVAEAQGTAALVGQERGPQVGGRAVPQKNGTVWIIPLLLGTGESFIRPFEVSCKTQQYSKNPL